ARAPRPARTRAVSRARSREARSDRAGGVRVCGVRRPPAARGRASLRAKGDWAPRRPAWDRSAWRAGVAWTASWRAAELSRIVGPSPDRDAHSALGWSLEDPFDRVPTRLTIVKSPHTTAAIRNGRGRPFNCTWGLTCPPKR